ncbi:lipoprotein-releasing ABC transporter permease subunit LolE [Gayadomonas joobiniege]|uniref:lipoprotein-releasing ABC transporter permease subunit LolE n=1 Tax=Gayadomonas joobiniege TaxID=1234606 RepID=UPI00036D271A|nr:lipoprotein-releasing ABC transporter permease subunit LolE [Gayadomonas joobiniege]
MFNRLSREIGYRYAQSRNHNAFIRFISASSVIGIALGVCVLIWVLSAMNGFERELKERLLSLVPHIEYTAVDKSGIKDWAALVKEVEAYPEVKAGAPFIQFSALLQKGSELKPVAVRGINWQYENRVSSLKNYLSAETIKTFNQKGGVILGAGLARKLNLTSGDWLDILVPQHSPNGRLLAPKLIRLPLAGVLESGGQLDLTSAFIQLELAQQELGWQDSVQGVRLAVNNVFAAPALAREIGYRLPVHVYMNDWTRTFGHIYNDIQMVRGIMYLILALVIAVACFNIVSTLVMAVNEKKGDIAIFMTMGMTRAKLIQIFMMQGLFAGVKGTLYGAGLGVLGAMYIGDLFAWIEQATGKEFISADIYFINFLPTELHYQDVILTCGCALLMSLTACLYPAIRAASIDPAQQVGQS